jgi:hypothetical protein
MLTHESTYGACLQGSVTKAWTVEDCFRGRDFDFDKPFLPDRIAGVNAVGCLTDDEKRMLNQIRGNSYCHIFAFVEEYIVPLVMDRARTDVYGDETRLWSLLRFAEEEVKHQEMLRRAVEQFQAGLDSSRAVISASIRVRSTCCGVQRWVLAVWSTSGAMARTLASFNRFNPATRSASSGGACVVIGAPRSDRPPANGPARLAGRC